MPEVPEVEEPDIISPQLEALAKTIASIQADISKIPTESLDLTDIKQAMETIYAAIEAKEVTPETDTAPILAAIDQLATDVIQELEYTRTFVQGTEKQMTETIVKTVESGMKAAKYVNEFRIEPATATKPVPQPEAPAYDINKLAS
jgi:hypothetical protein